MKKIGDMFSRGGYKLKTKFGHGENTRNADFEAAWMRNREEAKKVKLIVRDIERLMAMVAANTVVLTEIVDSFATFIPNTTARMGDLSASMTEIDNSRAQVEENLAQNLCTPMYLFYRQFRQLKYRAKVLEARRIDMDRFHEKLKSMTDRSATSGSAANISEADSRYKQAREDYERLANEMIVDCDRLHNAIAPFLEPCVAIFMQEHATYATTYGRVMNKFSNFADGVNTTLLYNYHDVITTQTESSSGEEGNLPTYKPKKKITPAQINAYSTVVDGAHAPEFVDTHVGYSNPAGSEMSGSGSAAGAGAGAAGAGYRAGPGPARSGRAPPPPPQRGGAQQRCRALYDFDAEDATELSFRAGDVINIIKKSQDWWEGELNGRRGLFPGNYVEMC